MANNQSYLSGIGGSGVQITTLSQIEGSGLKLPTGFIDLRTPGKLELLYNNNGNSNVLYGKNRPNDYSLSNILKDRLDYKNPNQGEESVPNTKIGYAVRDARFIRDFLGSSQGVKFIRNQLILQGYQPFDETKVYNPGSPLAAAFRLASAGAIDRPQRHIDTSNILGGIINGFGLGGIVSTIGSITGGSPPQPAPPRSSVASTASRGFGLSTFTSLLGGGDRSNEVVAPLARGDVKGLLRGQTATDAYNSPRYSKLVNQSSKGLFSRLLEGIGKSFINKTALGGIIPPKQPWNAQYRADEETYKLYLYRGGLFNSYNASNVGRPGILTSISNLLGFGRRTNLFAGRVTQRFYVEPSNQNSDVPDIKPGGRFRYISTSRKRNRNLFSSRGEYIDSVGIKFDDTITFINDSTSLNDNTDGYKRYTDVIKVDQDNVEYSDQLYNYKYLTSPSNVNNFEDTFSDPNSKKVKDLIETYNSVIKNITGTGAGSYEKYTDVKKSSYIPIQFANLHGNSNVGFNQLNLTNQNIKNTKNREDRLNNTYQSRFRNGSGNKQYPTRLGEKYKDRYIRPTNNVDYVNALEVLDEENFKNKYSSTSPYGKYGPDIIKFYFYDIINKKYIPFNATVKNINENNSANWDSIEYLGRADKLYYYKGFTRSLSFTFMVNAHSIKELMPMWKRINYLVGLTRPSNYTNGGNSGFIVPPMVQLTLGDFYQNHNVVINSCNISIPEETTWETLPEDLDNTDWNFGPESAITWYWNRLNSNIDEKYSTSEGRFAQFPKTVEIQIEMFILEKERPKTGGQLWGDSKPTELTKLVQGTVITEKINNRENTFSEKIRTDNTITQFSGTSFGITQ